MTVVSCIDYLERIALQLNTTTRYVGRHVFGGGDPVRRGLSRIYLGSSRCLKVEAGSYLAWKCASLSTISIRRWSVVIITAIQSPISRYGTE